MFSCWPGIQFSLFFHSLLSGFAAKAKQRVNYGVFCDVDTCPLGNALRPSTQFTSAREQLPDGNYFWSLPTWLNLNWWPRGEMLYILLLIPWGFQFLIHHFFSNDSTVYVWNLKTITVSHTPCVLQCLRCAFSSCKAFTFLLYAWKLSTKRMFPKPPGSFSSSLAMYFVTVRYVLCYFC